MLKRKSMSIVIILSMVFSLFFAVTPTVYAVTSYYVATTGNDTTGNGSLANPWRTIQKAASAAVAGDTVYIRGGTYRETVTPASSGTVVNPITFQNYNGEAVTVSGCDLVTGWTQYSGSIYRAPMNWNFDSTYGNMVYSDGNMMIEARWPNLTTVTDYLDPTKDASVDSATTGTRGTSDSTIRDSDLTVFTNDYWNGALVWCGNGLDYFASVADINNFVQSTGTIYHYPWNNTAEWYNTNYGGHINKYFIFRTLQALDAQKEWYYDGENNYLYFSAPGGDSPANHTVEAKRRAYGFDLSGKANITVKNIGLRGTSINFASTTNHCTLDGCNVNGVDTYLRADMIAGNYSYAMGIKINGTYNTVKNSEIYNTGSIAVTINGSYNSLVNCYIHDTNMFMNNTGAVNIYGHDQLVSNNTICNTGYIGIMFICQHSLIQYNNIYNILMIGNDGGGMYGYMTNLGGTEIHHNKVHDNRALYGMGMGIYFDSETYNGLVYDNVVWNNPHSEILHYYDYFDVINNTVYKNSSGIIYPLFPTSSPNTHYYNNIANSWWNGTTPGGALNNKIQTSDPGYVNMSNDDVHLTSSSVAKDAGLVIPGITNGYSGAAPDCGAYEYSGADWTAGHNFTSPPSPTLTFRNVAFRDKVINGGFDYADFTGWTKTGSQIANIVVGDSWDYQDASSRPNGIVRNGYYSAQIKTGSGIQQTISGLEPSTTYKLNAAVQVDGFYSKATEYSSGSGSSHWNFDKDGTTPASYRFMQYIGPMQNNDWLKFSNIDFGASAGLYNMFAAGLVNSISGGYIDVRIDSTSGTLLGTLTLAANASCWAFQSCSINTGSITGSHDVYLIFRGAGNISFIESFKLYNSTMNDTVTAGVSSYGGTDTSVSNGRTAPWMDNVSLQFTTGASNTSAVIYFTKLSGSYYGYIDHVFVTKLNGTPTTLFSDDFENGSANWTLSGSPTISVTQKHGGSSSLATAGNPCYVERILGSSQNNVAKVWFYDNASDTSLQNIAIVGDASNDRGLGVNTPTSAGYYCYRVGSTYTATTVARSTGWHEFKFDYSSGSGVSLYIDGTQVAGGVSGLTSFNRIVLGNSDGINSGNVYWDDFSIIEPEFSEGFENGFSDWAAGFGTASASTTQKHSGSYSFVANEDRDVIYHTFASGLNKVATLWFYDDGSGSKISMARVDNGSWSDGSTFRAMGVDTSVSATQYIYRASGPETASGVNRSTGWHKLQWDYTSGTKADMYIDNTLVASPTGITAFNLMAMGDWWSDSMVSTMYFDDIAISDAMYQYIDDDNASVTYSGTWTDDNNVPDYYNGNRHLTNTTNSNCQVSFTGTTIEVITEKYSNRGLADIYIDNVFDSTVDGYAATSQNQAVLYSKSGLSNGNHTIKVVCKGQHSGSSTDNYVIIDAFRYN